MQKRTAIKRDPRVALRQYLADEGLTQEELGLRIGLSISGLNDILTGRSGPGRKVMFRIEDETGIPARLWAAE